MALDGMFLRHIKSELEIALVGSRVDKIYQPNREEIVLSMRNYKDSYKVLISSRANSPRIHITNYSLENPKSPPMLCMLLRKKLIGARLTGIVQPGLERVLYLEFDAIDDFGDKVKLTLVTEIMGKYSNLILVDQDGKIVDALKRVDAEMSSQRLVLPGVRYELPPAQDKTCILNNDSNNILDRLIVSYGNQTVSKALLSCLQGISPVVCREIEHLVNGEELMSVAETCINKKDRLLFYIRRLISTVNDISGCAYMVTDNNNKPIEFSFMGISQYTDFASIKQYDTFSSLLDDFYYERDKIDRMRVKTHDLSKMINNIAEKIERKICLQKSEVEKCKDRDYLRMCADLISANLYRIQKGAESVSLENFYSESIETVNIKLDPSISPNANAQKYYKEYRKCKTAEQVLKQQISSAESELKYIESVKDSLSRAYNEKEINEIRQELKEQGYVRYTRNKTKEKALSPIKFKSTEGFDILVGRNNIQNDKLTLKDSNNNDIWFHTKDVPGSHTVVVTDGMRPGEQTILEACIIAAFHSKARYSSQVPVDFTQIRHVKKPQGARPGMVIYTNNKTMYVKPDEDIIEKLKCND